MNISHQFLIADLFANEITWGIIHAELPTLLINSRMSSTLQAVVLSPSFIDFGYLPDLTPLRNDVLLIGRIAGMGGSAFGSPTICLRRKKPVSGSCVRITM